MSFADDQLKVFEVGKKTVIGFGGHEVLDQLNVAVYRDHLLSIIEEHSVETLAFDLSGVILVPSGMLGLLASLHKEGVAVELYNPSEDIREVLEITQLNQLLTVCEGQPHETGNEPDVTSED